MCSRRRQYFGHAVNRGRIYIVTTYSENNISKITITTTTCLTVGKSMVIMPSAARMNNIVIILYKRNNDDKSVNGNSNNNSNKIMHTSVRPDIYTVCLVLYKHH